MHQESLRQHYLKAVIDSQKSRENGKQLISKSANLSPQIVALKDSTGQVIGFGMAEPYDAKEELSKSVEQSARENPADENSLFDSLFPLQSIGGCKGQVQKSAEPDENQILAGLFPQAYLSWPL